MPGGAHERASIRSLRLGGALGGRGRGRARASRAKSLRARLDVTVVRNGSRGMFWLEPLVEVETAEGRIAYGPVTRRGRRRSCSTRASWRASHTLLCLGPTEEIPYLKQQERLTFARCGIVDPLSLADYVATAAIAGLQNAL